METFSSDSRLETELSLLDSMYPSQCEYNARSRDLTFKYSRESVMILRLPPSYPESGLPDLISAHVCNNESRSTVQHKIGSLNLETDVETLDAIIAAFVELAEESEQSSKRRLTAEQADQACERKAETLTVVVWLHHLLATSKRKAALDCQHRISGITKPGYPGVMIFTGPASAVREHVTMLKGMKWQAFQIRYEENILWKLNHDTEIVEVEKLADVVDAILDPKHKELFLDVMKVK